MIQEDKMLDRVKTFYAEFRGVYHRHELALDKLDTLTAEFGEKLGEIEIKSVKDEIWYMITTSTPKIVREDAIGNLDPKNIREHGIKRTMVYSSLEERIK